MFASFIYFLGHLQGALWSSAPCAGLSPYRCHRLGLSTLCVIWYLFLPPSLRWLLRCILDMFIFWSLCQFVLWLSACVARFLVAPPTSCGGSVPGCCGGCRRVLFIECSLHNLCGVTLRLWWPLVRFFSRFRPPGLFLALWNVGFAVPWLPRSFSGLRVPVAAVLSASAKLELAWRPFHRFPDCVHAAVFVTSLLRLGVCGGYPTAFLRFRPILRSSVRHLLSLLRAHNPKNSTILIGSGKGAALACFTH